MHNATVVKEGVLIFMRETILWLMVVLVMGLIFYLSSEPADVSREGSIVITDKVLEFLQGALPDTYVDGESMNHFIRKSAHFLIYMVLGIFTYLACSQHRKNVSFNVIMTMVICVLYAISDEVHQLFVPGRSGEVGDVFIDGLGALLGVFFVLIMTWVVRKTRKLDQNY